MVPLTDMTLDKNIFTNNLTVDGHGNIQNKYFEKNVKLKIITKYGK